MNVSLSEKRNVRSTPWITRWSTLFAIIVLCAGVMWMLVFQSGTLSDERLQTALTHKIKRGDLLVSIREQGLLESSENVEIKSKVRGRNAVLWIIESGSFVEAGDELVRLDALFIQEQVDERTKYSNWSQSAADHTAAAVSRARLAVEEYEQGRFRADLMSLEKDIAVAKATLQNSRDRLKHVTVMASSGYVSELEVEENEFSVEQAQLGLKLKLTQRNVLKDFTYKEQLQTLKGRLTATEANHKANVERAMADMSRRERAVEELQHCVIRAQRSGLVIHPSAAKWESAPISEGTNVHRDQVLLLMPNLQKMHVKLGVHESHVKRIKLGQQAKVVLADGTTEGVVSEVASIAKPAGWWTGNQVRYDTLVALPPNEGLRPGLSAEVAIIVAEYEDVLLIPVAAVVIDERKDTYCWVKNTRGRVRRQPITLGDSNDVFSMVIAGIEEGDDVLLNPAAMESNRIDLPASEEAPVTAGAVGSANNMTMSS